MVDDEGENQRNAAADANMFFVRLGANDKGPFAVCERVGMTDGGHVVPGTGKTVAQLVRDQGLLAAAIPRNAEGEFRDLAEMDQSAADMDQSANNLAGGGEGGNN